MKPEPMSARAETMSLDQLRDLAVTEATRSPRSTQDGALDAIAVWRGLVEGRLRLVERFERCGWRYYVICENPIEALPFVSLAPRERRLAEIVGAGQSEKVAAYDLGVTPSVVSALLKTTLLKLGLRSRVDLVRLVIAMRADKAA